MDKSNSFDSAASDQDNTMQYIRQDSLQNRNYDENDDDSSKLFFVSEPSTSEADSSENLMRLAAVLDDNDNLLYTDPSGEEEDGLLFHSESNTLMRNESNDSGKIVSMQPPPTPPLPPIGSPPWDARKLRAAYSPDNMSLSSHETTASDGSKQKVELDFVPVEDMAKTGKTKEQQSGERGTRKTTQPEPPAPPQDALSNSSSEASEAQVKQLGEFLDDLRINSQGQVREASVPGSNTSFESSILVSRETEVEDVLRRSNARRAGRLPPDRESPRLSMDYTKDSFSNALVGDTIEIAASSPAPLPLPPLYAPGSTGGRKQAHDRQQRRWSTDAEKATPDQQHAVYHQYDNEPRKQTIEQISDERSKQQQKEIGLFSQFALGTINTNESPRGGRRRNPRHYGNRRGRHRRQESGEDSSSQASSDQSYVNFFQSPSQPSPDGSYPTNPLPSPRIFPQHGRTPSSGGSGHGSFGMLSPRSRPMQKAGSLNLMDANSVPAPVVFSSYDGTHIPARQAPPPLQLDSQKNQQAWGNPIYQSSPTYYFPGQQHKRVNSEMPRPQFEYNNQQYHHYRSHSAAYDSSPNSGSSYHFPYSPQHFPPTPAAPSQANQFFAEEVNRNRNQSYDSVHRTGSMGHDLQQFQMEQQRRDSYVFDDNTSYSVSDHSSDASIEKERGIHLLHDRAHHDNRVLRHHHFDDAVPKFDRRQFLPQTSTVSDKSDYPTFVCPNCGMRQREFFTVSSAPRQYESEGTMISLLFAVYVVASLYIFGLQEGWGKLDCFYFAVITLTTAGLGDLVPTTDGAKIICSMFIYFGVACIGLLLGSYIAGMLDERSYREAVVNQINACPNCARIKNIAEQRRAAFAEANDKFSMEHIAERQAAALHKRNSTERASKKIRRTDDSDVLNASQSMEMDKTELSTTPNTPSTFDSPTFQKKLLGSPMTSQILRRQAHTRHVSMDLRKSDIASTSKKNRISKTPDFDLNGRFRNNSADMPTVKEGSQSMYPTKNSTVAKNDGTSEKQGTNGSTNPGVAPPMSETQKDSLSDDFTSDDSDSYADSLESEVDEIEGKNSGVRNAKYVIYTLREALANSLLIIAFGCLGFYLIEGFSFVDSLYFTTVLLTSTGYGDIVPKSDGGKLFATVYLLVGGTILLNNMSMISMIPLELRRRRTEISVLNQFGDSLDDDALRELATGPLIQRIHLGGKDARGLDECTREMFALAMLIRLGKVTEHDIKMTFAAFRKLDVHNEGILNSKTIIGGMIQKRRQFNFKNKNNGSSVQQRYSGNSQVQGSWINYPAPPVFDGNRNRSSSTNGAFVPDPHGQNVSHSDHTPLLSMSERGFPHYGMAHQYPLGPPLNE